jgi:hypothetical protein
MTVRVLSNYALPPHAVIVFPYLCVGNSAIWRLKTQLTFWPKCIAKYAR